MKEPLSLAELIAHKKGNKNCTDEKLPTRVKFLTRSQRDKAEKEKQQKNTEDKEIRNQNKIKKAIKDEKLNNQRILLEQIAAFNASSTHRQNLPNTNNKQDNRKRKFNFDWNPEDDTLENFTPVLEIWEKQKPESFDVPRRKKGKDEYEDKPWPQKPLDKMTNRDWRILREDFGITSKGAEIENPLRNWNESKIPKLILDQLDKLGYVAPTPIQRAAIPMGLNGRDIIGIAETGSGKTLAFLIPILSYIMRLPPVGPFESPHVLILVPTRELALQIEKEFQKFYKQIRFNVASLIGGHTYDENISKLGKGVEVVIGTPGRLIDSIEKKILNLDKCYFLTLDEADRMIDMGFEVQVNTILESLPPGESNPFPIGSVIKRTTMMFTATMPTSIEKIAVKNLIKPATIVVGEIGGAVETVVQDAIQVSKEDDKKLVVLANLLKRNRSWFIPPIIIFVNYQKTCDIISDYLSGLGFYPAVMNGSRTQTQREEAIINMKNGSCDVLIATDIAGRGIDISDVSLVVNYQMSKTIEEYTHRIGRTGRAGKKGTAITFWNPDTDADVLYDLKTMIVKSPISKCPDDLKRAEHAQKKFIRNIDT